MFSLKRDNSQCLWASICYIRLIYYDSNLGKLSFYIVNDYMRQIASFVGTRGLKQIFDGI